MHYSETKHPFCWPSQGLVKFDGITVQGQFICAFKQEQEQGTLPAPAIPHKFSLDQNYPNPFNPETTIKYSLDEQEHVFLVVYNALGEQVAVLVDTQQQAGSHSVIWNGTAANHGNLSSGIYFCKIFAGSFTRMKKMIYMR
ncbi:T9SS type A sorting domain-containing protein [candidate division KSB1 bacterium]|nr:T9SS type A sorting domain-containing protein [candidate division KSB1 bacterium]